MWSVSKMKSHEIYFENKKEERIQFYSSQNDISAEDEIQNERSWIVRNIKSQLGVPKKIVELVTFVLLSVLGWSFLFLIVDEDALPDGQLFKFLSMFLLAFINGKIVSLVKLPPLLGMLITGIFFKAVGFIDVSGEYSQNVIILRNLALTVILIKAGLGLDASALLKLKYSVLKLGILPCTGEAIATALICKFLLGYPWLWSFLLGFLLGAVSPAVVIPPLLELKEQGYGNGKGISTLVIAASSLDDIFSISFFGVLLSSIFSTGSLTMEIIRGPLELVIGLLIGVLWGFICACLPNKDDNNLVFKRSLMIGFGSVVFILGSLQLNYPGAGPLACITSAFTANIAWILQGQDIKNPVAEVYSFVWLVVQPILFSLIGAEVDVKSLSLDDVGWSILVIFGALTFRIFVCSMSLFDGVLNWKEIVFVNLAWLPKATVQAAFAPQPLDILRRNESEDEYAFQVANFILTTAVIAIVLTAPIGAIAISWSGTRLLNKYEKI